MAFGAGAPARCYTRAVTEKPQSRNSDIVLAAMALVMGASVALGYAAWHAVSREGEAAADRWGAFTDAMVFPGLLIVAAIAVVVWMGWKANID